MEITKGSISYELLNKWISNMDIKQNSLNTYEKSIRLFIKWLNIKNITNPEREDIISYKRYLEKSLKPTTIQIYIASIKQFFKWLDQEGIYKNIASNIKGAKIGKQHKKDYLTIDQIKNVLKKIDRTTEKGLRDYTLISIMLIGGLRTIEVSRANLEDLRILGSNSVLFIQGKGRDEKIDYVKLPQEQEEILRSYLEMREKKDKCSALFTSTSNNNKGDRMTTRSISVIVKSRLRNAGYDSDRLTAHSLRHTAVTLSLIGGRSLQDVQQFARHSNIATTQVYAHNLDRASNQCEETIANAIDI